ncbi:hypothetical protein A1Q2_02101 [Trichosporon asahii var. asahii CBS 8904]|uniref:Uncharacterized protein n=2 Tax=Trichosporon asahii var. asahii TaxID=189963 RepID=K1WRI6_TRIAC|nr:hypothetical protein A1Q1_04100 [Trichosporon asahii var. asahii CBS 2479]EJT47107.1 hypothetical protein A1Q1_04100 [Trichosporon asahii var. asahii CBS 2479]EKD03624.1 hypothetical protein A1Q2_02101 [Trichosporon asahii var. asahii CBS 8904]
MTEATEPGSPSVPQCPDRAAQIEISTYLGTPKPSDPTHFGRARASVPQHRGGTEAYAVGTELESRRGIRMSQRSISQHCASGYA